MAKTNKNTDANKQLRLLPGIDEVLKFSSVAALAQVFGLPLVKSALRQAMGNARRLILDCGNSADIESIIADAANIAAGVGESPLRPVINATGIVLHTNLGRAPLGPNVIDEIVSVARGYCNLEFDLDGARRGSRNSHVREILKFLTRAEDALVVNNNAAGVMLALNCLARDREVIVSRGELIEIGASFRLPEIMAASGARLVDVGTTNCTHLSDYASAIGPDTAILLKAHKSNYAIRGFSSEVTVKELARLAHEHGLIMMYDIGSGLLRKPKFLDLLDEPDVASAIADEADLVTFSGDKLLGGPQAGIVVGRSDLIGILSQAALMRVLRVCKLTLAALSAACRNYLHDDKLPANNPIFGLLERSHQELEHLASSLLDEFKRLDIDARIVESTGRCGGGALPDLEISSVAVEVLPQGRVKDRYHTFAERLYVRLLHGDLPVLAILREGRILFDVLAVFPENIPDVARVTSEAINAEVEA